MHCIHYVLFENAMGLVRLGAVVAGMQNSFASGHMLYFWTNAVFLASLCTQPSQVTCCSAMLETTAQQQSH